MATKRRSRRKGTTVAAATAGFVEAELGVDITQNKVLVHLDDKLYYQDKTFPTTTALLSFLNTLGARVASGEVFITAGRLLIGDGEGRSFYIRANTGEEVGDDENTYLLTDGRIAQALTGPTASVDASNIDAEEWRTALGVSATDDVVKTVEKGAALGVATLGSDSKIPLSQLPDTPEEIDGGYDAT